MFFLFYFDPSQFPCAISDYKNHNMEIYKYIAKDLNACDDDRIFTPQDNGNGILVTKPEDPDFENYLLKIKGVESVSRVKVTLYEAETDEAETND